MSYNLDEQVPEGFEFVVGGHTYRMRYPTTEEILDGQNKKGEQEQLKWLYSFISATEEGVPSIEEALARVNVKVLQKFNHMIKSEFGAE